MTIRGTAGDDLLVGTPGDDIFILRQGGDDTASGLGGNDIFKMGSALNAADKLDGGDGTDSVWIKGDYAQGLGLVFDADTITNIEVLRLGPGFDYKLTMNDGNVAAGEWLTINAGPLRAGNHLTFDGSQELNGHFTVYGGAGSDTITGGALADDIYVGRGGNDTVFGGGGDDTIHAGGALTASDRLDGGAGANRIVLDGDYSAGLTLASNTIVNFETLRLLDSYSYKLTTNDGNVAAGQTLTIDARPISGGHHLIFNGAPELDGHFAFLDSQGDDTLTGGSQSDTFSLIAGGDDTAHGGGGDDTFTLGEQFSATDNIDGGTGNDTVSLQGDYSGGVVFGATTMTGVETLDLLATSGSYNLTTNNATVANGATLTVNGASLIAGESLDFDGSAETDGHFHIYGGAGDDVLRGGAQSDFFDVSTGGSDTVIAGDGNDLVYAGAAFDFGDGYEGNGGYDTMELAGVGTATYTGANTLNLSAAYLDNFEQIRVDGGGSYHIVLADDVANSTFTIDASGLLAADNLDFNGSAESTSSFKVLGGAHFGASDSITGGAAYDTLELNGDYTGGNALVFGPSTMVGFEQITCDAGHSYNLTANSAIVPSGSYLFVDASALTAGESLTFNGSAMNDPAPGLSGNLIIDGGAGDDHLTGSVATGLATQFELAQGGNDTATGLSGDDNFFMGATLTAADTLDGGGGYDQVFLNGDYSGANAVTFAATTMVNVEYLAAGGAFDYDLTTVDATVASGQTLVVDGGQVLTGHSLVFDGSAETDGSFGIIGGGGDDLLAGGDQADGFNLTNGGDDTAYGGDGNDSFIFGVQGFDFTGAFTAADTIDGGAGNDTVTISGDYTGIHALVFGPTTMINVENLTDPSGNADLTTNNATVAAGQTLNVGCLGQLTFDGSAETDGHFNIGTAVADNSGLGASDDVLIGGGLSDTFNIGDDIDHHISGNDTITGGGGGDLIHASSNAADSDTFIYKAVTDSTSTGYDTITSMNFDNDLLLVSSFATLPGAIDTAVNTGTLSTASFDGDLAAAIGAGQLGAHDAILFTADAGGLSGHTFLVVDINGNAGYQAGQDLVIDVTGYTGTLTTADFS